MDNLAKIKKLADAMYYAAMYLTTDASRLHKAMDDYHKFIIHEWKEEPVSEPNKELAETYLAVFNKKFPILPSLKGKQLADYKNFLNKCQQIFGLKEWGIHPIQSKLFEKLTLLWAAWGAKHLQGVGRQDEKEQDLLVSEDFEKALASEWKAYNDRGAATTDALEDNTQELAFAKGFYRGSNWRKEKDSIVSDNLEEAIGEYCSNPDNFATWIGGKENDDIPLIIEAIKFGAKWKEQQMMAKAFDVEIDSSRSDGKRILSGNFFKFNTGDKVKVILIKGEEI